jgi:hypothetical protein
MDALSLVSAGSVWVTGRAPVLDQVGQLPVAVWLGAWARDWRDMFGHDPRPRGRQPGGVVSSDRRMAARLLDSAAWERVERVNPDHPDGEPIVEWLNRPRPTDVVDAEWRSRFGVAAGDQVVVTDAGYLAATLGWACEQHPDIGGFLTQLRAVVGAVRAAVGERSDLVYLGRCPEVLRDRETGGEEPCGAHLVQDAHVSLVVCPRCRAETPERRWLWLAGRIRATWGDADREAWSELRGGRAS